MHDLYPGAVWKPSPVIHPRRPETLGVVIHWTAGTEPGDVKTLTGGNVDVQFYVTKTGRVYQFLDPDSQAWHAMQTANRACVGIETEGRGEAWTGPQFEATAALTAWLCRRYRIPVRKVDPTAGDMATFRGVFGHRDLSLGGRRVDGNDHTDTVPDGTGWPRFIQAVKQRVEAPPVKDKEKPLAVRIDEATRFGQGSSTQIAQLIESGQVRLSDDADELMVELANGGFSPRSALVVIVAREALIRGWLRQSA